MGKLALNNALDNVRDIKPLPDYSALIRHDLKHQRFNNLDNGLYVSKGSTLSSLITDIKKPFYDEMPGLMVGRQESRHSVSFGRLGGLAMDNYEEIVAVKQSNKPEQLLGELAMLQFLQDKTPFPTFRPVAYLSNQNEGYLFTEFNPNIFVIGMFDWQHATADQKNAIINEISTGLGRLHANFLYHGDAFVRNLAINNRNKFFIVDPELMMSGRSVVQKLGQNSLEMHEKDAAMGQLIRPMITDLSAFYKSLIPRAFKKSKLNDSQSIFDFIQTNILPGYKQGLLSAELENINIINELYDIIEETLRQRAEQEIL